MGVKYKSKKYNSDRVVAVTLAVLLLFVIILTATLAYLSRDKSISGKITLGEIDFSVFGNQVQVQDIVPGDIFENSVSLVNARDTDGRDKNGLGSILVKYNLKNSNNDAVIIPVFAAANKWTRQGDTYYYNYSISPGEAIKLCDELQLSEHAGNEYQNKELNVIFNVDAIQAENEAYKELWYNAPDEWKQKIENNLL